MNGSFDCPFKAAKQILQLMKEAGAIITIIDVHGETTSEKIALAHYLDGELSALVGTHTHVQTNDAQIMPHGLAYITDLGMTGSHAGIIGMIAEGPLNAFLTGRPFSFKPAVGNLFLHGVIMDFDEQGKATSISCFQQAEADPENALDDGDGS
jgi:calcineurin-like phosphoesterase